MNNTKHLLDSPTRPVLRLSEIERLIKKHRILTPVPSRPSLIKLIEAGVFESAGDGPTSYGWLVYEDSFLRWAGSIGEATPQRVGKLL